jgi:hypothetical protein
MAFRQNSQRMEKGICLREQLILDVCSRGQSGHGFFGPPRLGAFGSGERLSWFDYRTPLALLSLFT